MSRITFKSLFEDLGSPSLSPSGFISANSGGIEISSEIFEKCNSHEYTTLFAECNTCQRKFLNNFMISLPDSSIIYPVYEFFISDEVGGLLILLDETGSAANDLAGEIENHTLFTAKRKDILKNGKNWRIMPGPMLETGKHLDGTPSIRISGLNVGLNSANPILRWQPDKPGRYATLVGVETISAMGFDEVEAIRAVLVLPAVEETFKENNYLNHPSVVEYWEDAVKTWFEMPVLHNAGASANVFQVITFNALIANAYMIWISKRGGDFSGALLDELSWFIQGAQMGDEACQESLEKILNATNLRGNKILGTLRTLRGLTN
jgi:hypothetical protein